MPDGGVCSRDGSPQHYRRNPRKLGLEGSASSWREPRQLGGIRVNLTGVALIWREARRIGGSRVDLAGGASSSQERRQVDRRHVQIAGDASRHDRRAKRVADEPSPADRDLSSSQDQRGWGREFKGNHRICVGARKNRNQDDLEPRFEPGEWGVEKIEFVSLRSRSFEPSGLRLFRKSSLLGIEVAVLSQQGHGLSLEGRGQAGARGTGTGVHMYGVEGYNEQIARDNKQQATGRTAAPAPAPVGRLALLEHRVESDHRVLSVEVEGRTEANGGGGGGGGTWPRANRWNGLRAKSCQGGVAREGRTLDDEKGHEVETRTAGA
ncbi:hypothetical protein C8J57DRAFT_1219214 [Mycena rebaudengoi]|nr:hypothetical protein C8J57DRAFT_1219214 [Mycena rebaudengoi]